MTVKSTVKRPAKRASKPAPTPPPQMADIPALEPEPKAAPEIPAVNHFPTYPDDLAQIAEQAYTAAIDSGMGAGDALANGVRAARKWAREHNRRMPD